MAIYDIRRANARYLATKFRNQREYADAANISSSQLSQRIGPNPTENIGESIARRIEIAAKKEKGWLDHEHPEVTGKKKAIPERYVDPDKLMVAAREVWETMESRGEKITPTLLISAALIYMRLREARGEATPEDADQSVAIAHSTIQSVDFTR